MSPDHPVILYDGSCGLCDRFVRYVLAHDVDGRFHFATLQGARGRAAVAASGGDPDRMDSVCVTTAEGRVLRKSRAVAFVLRQLRPPFWWLPAAAITVLPRVVADGAYDVIARVRYRLFGRVDACALPDARWRARFLADAAPHSADAPQTGSP